jgi:hypothetical protein
MSTHRVLPRLLAIALCGASLSCAPCSGGDSGARPACLHRWLRQLEADEFARRRDARRELVAAGRGAVAAILDRAREPATLNLAAECVRVLQELRLSDDLAVAARSKQALERLTESEQPEFARLAADALFRPTAAD